MFGAAKGPIIRSSFRDIAMLSVSLPEPEMPLIEPDATKRRVVDRMLARWDDLRQGRDFPSRADIERAGTGKLERNLFLVAMSDEEADDEVIDSGSALREALGVDPVGRRVVEILPSSTERGLSFCRTAARFKKPIMDVGNFTNPRGEEILYRSIILPLSDDQENINYLVGAFSYKQVS